MKSMVTIEVILDDNCADPQITIRTRSRTRQVESIIEAIEDISEEDYPPVSGFTGNKVELVSQKDIIRVYTQGRKVMIQTDEKLYSTNKSLSNLEEILNSDRFLRISQSEIVNLYRVKCFDFNLSGTIGVELDNGIKSWASRSKVRTIKALLKAGSTIAKKEED